MVNCFTVVGTIYHKRSAFQILNMVVQIVAIMNMSLYFFFNSIKFFALKIKSSIDLINNSNHS